jgi:hypothetical protein
MSFTDVLTQQLRQVGDAAPVSLSHSVLGRARGNAFMKSWEAEAVGETQDLGHQRSIT